MSRWLDDEERARWRWARENWPVVLFAMPFMAGLLWHRGSALWAVVSTVWGCWTRGVNC